MKLSEVGEWRGGSTPSKANQAYWASGTVPWVSPKDMKSSEVSGSQEMITRLAVRERRLKLIPAGSLLVVVRSSILKHTLPLAINRVPVAINQDMRAVVPSTHISVEYLYLTLLNRRAEVLSKQIRQGTTVDSIDINRFLDMEVHVPTLDKQIALVKSISRSIDAIKDVRSQLSKVPAIVDSYRRRFITRCYLQQKGNSPVYDDAMEMQLKVPLRTIGEIQTGIALGKVRNPDQNLVRRPYLRVANVQRGFFELEDVRMLAVTPVEATRFQLKDGDILLNEGGDRDKLGRGAVWREDLPNCLHQNHVFRLRLHDATFPPEYISIYMNEMAHASIDRLAKQTTNLASISKNSIGSIEVPYPNVQTARETLLLLQEGLRRAQEIAELQLQAVSYCDDLERLVVARGLVGQLLRDEDYIPSVVTSTRGQEHSMAIVDTDRESILKDEPTVSLKERVLRQLDSTGPSGATFEDIWAGISVDYDAIKNCVFELLTDEMSRVEQWFDADMNVMMLGRRVP